MKKAVAHLARASALASAAAALSAAPAAADTINTNTLGDEYNSNVTTCSLREAVQASNTDALFNGCTAGNGPDQIVLGDGVYEFDRTDTGGGNDNGDLDVTTGDTLTITHAGGARAAIDALDIDRVINVEGGASLTLNGVEIRGGRTTSENGGGIANAGALTMTNATVDDNEILTAGYGVGIWSLTGTISLTNVTVSGNIAAPGSAGAGGIYVNTPGNSLTNVTVSNNSGGGGSGGGLNVGGSAAITLKNTLIAGNTAGAAPDCSAFVGGITSLDHNLIGNTGGCNFSSQSGDVLNQPAGLSPLADNGGPVPTHALSPGSNALDKASGADCAGLTTDARGYPRPFPASGACDIGAYELFTCSGTPLNVPGAFGGCPQPQADPPAAATTATQKKCKKGRKLKKGKCVKKKRKKGKR